MLSLVLVLVAGYLLGSVPSGVWVGALVAGRDVRSGGSGHSGATNTWRQAGLPAAVVVAVFDLAKGFAAGWIGQRLGASVWAPALATAAVVAGHCWPMLAGLRGGIGLAPLAGAMLAIAPLGALVGLGLAIASTLLLRHSARGNVLSGLLFGPVLWLLTGNAMPSLAAGAGGLVIAIRSMTDWRRVYRQLWLDRERPAPPRLR